MSQVDLVPKKKRAVLPSSWVFMLDPYDQKAKDVIEYLKKARSPNYTMQVRGRGSRKDHHDRQSIPLSRAEWVTVYIYGKDKAELPTKTVSPPKPKVKVEKKKKTKLPGGSLPAMLHRIERENKSGK